MAQAQLEVIAIAAMVAAGCALVGSFLLLRRMSLMSDAISHSILFGIVIMYFLIESTASLPMVVAATATGVLTVLLVESLFRTGLVKEDAAIGLVFPVLFSIGVILISRYAGSVHLDVDAVILGELAFAPFDRLIVAGTDLGPRALWLAGAITLVNLVFIVALFKELKLATFDAGLAAALGLAPSAIHYALMTLVSVTAVGSFEAVGSVLVVAFMIAPPATAYLLTDRLPVMLALSVATGVVAAVLGYFVAHTLNASIAGSMATMTGVLFAAAVLAAPQRGVIAQWLRRRQQRWQFAGDMVLVHLLNHEGTADEREECSRGHIIEQMTWTTPFADGVLGRLRKQGLIRDVDDAGVGLTADGRAAARDVMLR